MEVCRNKHIEEHREKIARILIRNEEQKRKDRERKLKFVEIHQQKMEDIEKFKREFDRIRLEIGSTFLTS